MLYVAEFIAFVMLTVSSTHLTGTCYVDGSTVRCSRHVVWFSHYFHLNVLRLQVMNEA